MMWWWFPLTCVQILTPFLLRRLKTDVELKIPPKKEVLVYAPITPRQVELYKGILDHTIFGMLRRETSHIFFLAFTGWGDGGVIGS